MSDDFLKSGHSQSASQNDEKSARLPQQLPGWGGGKRQGKTQIRTASSQW